MSTDSGQVAPESASGPAQGPQEGGAPNLEKGLNAPEGTGYGSDVMHCEATRLMTAAKNGDTEAFDALVTSMRGRAFQVARSLVGSHDDAMELSQEAFLKLFKARDTYRDGEPFLPWFHRILRNTCFSFLRQRGRLRKRSLSSHAPDVDGDEGDWELVDDGPGPTEQVEQTERAQVFWEAFQTLSAKDREILALRHFKELSYRDLAQTFDIPVGTVMSRLFHARRRLREKLEIPMREMGEFQTVPAENDEEAV